jgi:hypothetical protein
VVSEPQFVGKSVAKATNNQYPHSGKNGDGAAIYVQKGVATIKTLATIRALNFWWANEKVNRERCGLVEHTEPGFHYSIAYRDRRADLQVDTLGVD